MAIQKSRKYEVSKVAGRSPPGVFAAIPIHERYLAVCARDGIWVLDLTAQMYSTIVKSDITGTLRQCALINKGENILLLADQGFFVVDSGEFLKKELHNGHEEPFGWNYVRNATMPQAASTKAPAYFKLGHATLKGQVIELVAIVFTQKGIIRVYQELISCLFVFD